MYECLFEENQIGTMKLKNRLIVPAMSTRFVGEDGRATEQFTAYHETRAKGGWALIITEDFLIDEGVGIKKELPGLWDDGQIEGYKKCTDRIHAAGGKICAQIYQRGGIRTAASPASIMWGRPLSATLPTVRCPMN